MMKRVIAIASSTLVALGMSLLATAANKTSKQTDKYVKVDQELIDKAADKVVADIPEKDKRLGTKELIKQAFEHYTTGNAAKVEVYEKDEINAWKDSVKTLNNQIKQIVEENKVAIKPHRDTIADLRKQMSQQNVAAQINAIKSKHRDDSLAQESVIKAQKAEVARLRGDSVKLAKSNAEFARDADIVKKVKDKVGALRGEVDALYSDYKNSQDLKYVNPSEAEKVVKDYVGYLDMIGVSMPQEQKDKIEHIQVVAKVAKHYHDGIEILGKKYDANVVKTWNDGTKGLAASIAKLNSGQRAVWENECKAMENIAIANDYFRTEIVQYLKDQEILPTQPVVNEAKDMVKLCVGNFAKSRKYTDTTKFHPLYMHLNKVLAKTFEGLKVEKDKEKFGKFLKEIEDSL